MDHIFAKKHARALWSIQKDLFDGAKTLDFSFDLPTEEQMKSIENQWEDLVDAADELAQDTITCLLYTSPSPRDRQKSRMPSSA